MRPRVAMFLACMIMLSPAFIMPGVVLWQAHQKHLAHEAAQSYVETWKAKMDAQQHQQLTQTNH
jgi:hypothetical protein